MLTCLFFFWLPNQICKMKLVSLKRERNVSSFKMAPFCLIRRNTKYNQTQPQQTNPKPQIFSSTPREPKTQQRLIVNVKPSARPDQIQGGGVADGQFSFWELGFISYNLSTQLCIHVMFTIWGFGFVLLWLSLEIVTWNVWCHKFDCLCRVFGETAPFDKVTWQI